MTLHSFVASIGFALASSLWPTPATARVSTSIVLCFDAGERAVSSRVAAEVAGFTARSKGLGPVVALFFTTAVLDPVESDGASDNRLKELAAYLASKGFASAFTDFKRIEAASSDLGCAKAKIAIEIEAIFPHDGYK